MKAHLNLSGLKKLEQKLVALESKKVEWGYVTPGIHSQAGIPYANLAKLLEYGGFNIPSRPAFRDHVQKLMTSDVAFKHFVQPSVNKYLSGPSNNPTAIFNTAGGYLAEMYKGSMEDWVLNGSQYRNNHRTTIDLKGFNQPFVESGELISHVNYRVR